MKAVLISFNGLGSEEVHTPALAPLILRPIFMNQGWKCDILDAALLARELRHQSTQALINSIATEVADAELVGFTTRCDTYPLVLSAARLIKARSRSTLILLGGPHATATARATLIACAEVDFILKSEAEVSLPKFLQAIKSGESLKNVPGLAFRGRGRLIQENPEAPLMSDLGARPEPDYEFFARRYGNHLLNLHEVELGRGCPFKCNFCFTTEMWRREYRLRPPGEIAKEITLLRDRYHSRVFHLIHDNLIIKKGAYIRELIHALAPVQGVNWGVSSRIDTLDVDLLPALAKVGLSSLFIGIETGNEEKKKDLNKRWTLARCQEVVRAADAARVSVILSFIVGFPGETREQTEETVKFAAECASHGTNVHIQFHAFALEAGTPLLDKHIHELCYTGLRGDHIRIPWVLEDDLISEIKANRDLYSTFYSLRSDGVLASLPYAIQDIVGATLNYFRNTWLHLSELDVTIDKIIDAALTINCEQNCNTVDRSENALKLARALVERWPASKEIFAFEATCLSLAKGSGAMSFRDLSADCTVYFSGRPALSEVTLFTYNSQTKEGAYKDRGTLEIFGYLISPSTHSTAGYKLWKLSRIQFFLVRSLLEGTPHAEAFEELAGRKGRFSVFARRPNEYINRAQDFIQSLANQGILPQLA